MDIAKRIKTIREKKGMSQKELITTVGLGAPMYSRIETGKAEPSLTTLEKIAKALGVKLVDFFEADDNNLEDINSYDASLMEKVKTIEELNADEKKMVFAFVYALVGKKKMNYPAASRRGIHMELLLSRSKLRGIKPYEIKGRS